MIAAPGEGTLPAPAAEWRIIDTCKLRAAGSKAPSYFLPSRILAGKMKCDLGLAASRLAWLKLYGRKCERKIKKNKKNTRI